MIDELNEKVFIITCTVEDGNTLISKPCSAKNGNKWMHSITESDPDKKYSFWVYQLDRICVVSENGTKKNYEPS